MGKITTGATMSIDGYIAGPGESGFDLLFQWYGNGDDNFIFVTEGIEAAVAKARQIAGDKNVGVNGGQMAHRCLEAGLLDEVHIDLVPVLLGDGTPLLSGLGLKPVQLEGPICVVEGIGVNHIPYAVRKDQP